MTYYFLPVISFNGKRYRARARLTKSLRLGRRVDTYAEGTVYTYWLFWVLLVVMFDQDYKRDAR